MKKFTVLTMLVALISVTAFAQRVSDLRPWQGTDSSPSTTIKGIAHKAPTSVNKAMGAPSALVTPPAAAKVETWYTADGSFYAYSDGGFQNYTSYMANVNVAVDGDDIYIQGISAYFPSGWIKGRVNGSTAVFDNGQYVGGDDQASDYIVGSDDGRTSSDAIVFNYDAEDGILASVTGFIIECPSTQFTGSAYAYWSGPTFTRNDPRALVVAPEGLQTEEWALSATTNYGDDVYGYVNIGFSGNEVYMQGLCTYLPESWIKGKLNGNTITFRGNQYFGPYDDGPWDHYEFYLRKDDVVFTYDAQAGKMTAEGEVYIYTDYRKGDVYNNPVLTKVTEMAATPATPSISQVYESTPPIVLFSVPTFDIDGNAMASSKLSFKFLKDVEGEISDVVFDAADYNYLQESIVLIPYGFNDGLGNDGEFHPKYIHLKQADYGTWNKIGIQSIYTGGGEENTSEIFWLDIKPYQKATFDFNAMDVACSSSDSNAGDITEDCVLTANKVTLTVSPRADEDKTQNRFWSTSNGPQLRVYSGTLTFQAPVGKVITKMVFNYGRWNDGNSADSGEFDGNVWTGEAKKVVVTIAGNTQLNSIEVYPSDYVPTAVEAPEGLVVDTYVLTANSIKPYYDPTELTLWVKAGFDGDDVYIQGLAADCNSSAADLWVKATKNEAGQYVIPANQFMGSVSFWMSSMDYYFTAVDEDENMVDAIFDFDAEKQQFTSEQTMAINASLTELVLQQAFSDIVITKFNEVAATPADPTFEKIDFGEWSHSIMFTIPTVGTGNEMLNPNKLFYTVWIEKSGVVEPYTFTAEMYYREDDATELPYASYFSTWDNAHSIYFYDDASVFDTWDSVGVQSIYYGGGECKKSNIVWTENPILTGINEIDGSQTGRSVYSISGQRLEAPVKGLNIINGRKVLVK